MTRLAIAFAATLVATTGHALAECDNDTPVACMVGAKHGFRECVGGRFSACLIEPPPSPPAQHGVVKPKYFVTLVVYALPGTHGGHSTSSVSYANGSTAGTLTSVNKSFKTDDSISVTASASVAGNGGSVGVSFDYSHNNSDGNSLNITKSESSTIANPGPGTDGIDHDRDQIWLWLNPTLDVTVQNKSVVWSVNGSVQQRILYVDAGWLRNPSLMPSHVAKDLEAYNITKEDYINILKRDPLANGSPASTTRYEPIGLGQTFPYEPPYGPTDPVPLESYTLTNSSTATTTSSTEDDYNVALTVEGDTSFLDIIKLSLQTKDSWAWTNTSSTSRTAATTQTATVAIGGPSYGYEGPVMVEVLYDRIYKTFAFRFVDPKMRPVFNGVVKNSNGQPVARKAVDVVVANGNKYRTFTNAKGEYKVFGNISGPITIETDGTKRNIPQITGNAAIDIELP
jgi:hypothetical protein